MNRKVKQKKNMYDLRTVSGFGKAWQEAEQLVYVAEYEANKLGVIAPPAEQIVGHLFQLREDLGNPNDLYHIALVEQLKNLKQQEKENE